MPPLYDRPSGVATRYAASRATALSTHGGQQELSKCTHADTHKQTVSGCECNHQIKKRIRLRRALGLVVRMRAGLPGEVSAFGGGICCCGHGDGFGSRYVGGAMLP